MKLKYISQKDSEELKKIDKKYLDKVVKNHL